MCDTINFVIDIRLDVMYNQNMNSLSDRSEKMMKFFAENIGTIITCLILLAMVALAVRMIISNKRKGKSTCGCHCENCPYKKGCR